MYNTYHWSQRATTHSSLERDITVFSGSMYFTASPCQIEHQWILWGCVSDPDAAYFKCKFLCFNNYYIEIKQNPDISISTGMKKTFQDTCIWIFKVLKLNTCRNRTFSSICISMALKISVLKISKFDLTDMNEKTFRHLQHQSFSVEWVSSHLELFVLQTLSQSSPKT